MTIRKHAMRLVLTLLALASVAGATPPQQLASVDRGPRFLWKPSHNAAPVPVDFSASPALRRRVTLTQGPLTLAEALKAIQRQTGLRFVFSEDLIPTGQVIVLDAKNITVAAALTEILIDTGVDVVFYSAREAGLVRRVQVTGVIVGRVTDSATGAGLSSATVLIEGVRLSATTSADGRYRIEQVPAGTHPVVVRRIGYGRARRQVTVGDNQNVTADFALGAVASPLEEVVVTGTAFAAKVRTLPNPINVITAKEIEAKGAGNITDLLRGEIPGVMALSAGQENYTSRIYVRGNGAWASTDVLKIYLNGVEVASPSLLSTIDPTSIERIEVIRGPQASVIYGSEASGGVMQIFTKKGGAVGVDRARLELQMSLGVIESAYKPSWERRPLTTDYSVSLSGGREGFGYRGEAGYATVGEWLTGYGSATKSLSGGLHAEQGRLTAELSALWSERSMDYGNSPIYHRWPASADCPFCGDPDAVPYNYDFGLGQSTMGLTLGYRATDKWQHSLVVGQDVNSWGYYQPEPAYTTPADTLVFLLQRDFRRRSLRYQTAYAASPAKAITVRLTGGLDYWSYDIRGVTATNLRTAFGTVQTSPSTSTTLYNDGWWNTGLFAQGEVGIQDQLFMTLAARVEDNPHLGEKYGRAVSPRVGLSWARALGPAELKLRAGYGKGVRPPPDVARAGQVSSTSVYLPNPQIGPEDRAGWDAGVDLTLGRWGRLSLTRYSEEGRNLIQVVNIDVTSVPRIYQYQNIGRVGSEGWEIEGGAEVGRVSMKANYAYAGNQIRELSNAYAATPNQIYQVGDRMMFVPTHSGGGTVTARLLRGSVSLNASVMKNWRGLDYIAYYGYFFGGEPYRGTLRDYYVIYSDALWKWNLRAEQAVTDRWAAFLRVDNLANDQTADLVNFYVNPGRTTVLGLRFTH